MELGTRDPILAVLALVLNRPQDINKYRTTEVLIPPEQKGSKTHYNCQPLTSSPQYLFLLMPQALCCQMKYAHFIDWRSFRFFPLSAIVKRMSTSPLAGSLYEDFKGVRQASYSQDDGGCFVCCCYFCFNQNMGLCTLLPSAGQTDLGNTLCLRADTFTSTLKALPGQASQRQA